MLSRLYRNVRPIDYVERKQTDPPPYLEIVVRHNQKLNLTQKTFEASQSVHRYQDALKTFFPGYFGRLCEHRALLPVVVLGDVIDIDSYGVVVSKSKESTDTNKRK